MSAVETASGAAVQRGGDVHEEHVAHNYHPLPVVIAEGEGAWVTDADFGAFGTKRTATGPRTWSPPV